MDTGQLMDTVSVTQRQLPVSTNCQASRPILTLRDWLCAKLNHRLRDLHSRGRTGTIAIGSHRALVAARVVNERPAIEAVRSAHSNMVRIQVLDIIVGLRLKRCALVAPAAIVANVCSQQHVK
jgi:hypothetical protein